MVFHHTHDMETPPPPRRYYFRLAGGAMVPLVAIGGEEDGVAPSTSVVLEGLKLGERQEKPTCSLPVYCIVLYFIV